ncbi:MULTISPECIES: hypothetical protein [Luteibacter]|uniref:hypothetical protein n=1 Tax=Luteibacter TaxID=242605 RepID=UPI00055B9970|nr:MULTISPECIES: hypothetical protein [unclassified Luteibacter]
MSVKIVFVIVWALGVAYFSVMGAPLIFGALAALVPAGLAAGVRRMMRPGQPTPSNAPRGKAPLTVTPLANGWTEIDACPPPLPGLFTALPVIFGLMVALIVANVGPWHSLAGMLLPVLIAGGVSAGLLEIWSHSVQNRRRGLQPAAFAVSADAVRLPSGAVVPASRVYALTLRNGVDQHIGLMVTNSTIAAAGSIGSAHAAAKVARIAFRVDLDHDGRSSTLAGGLTEAQARSVAAEIFRHVPTLP